MVTDNAFDRPMHLREDHDAMRDLIAAEATRWREMRDRKRLSLSGSGLVAWWDRVTRTLFGN
jgi:hypothetical protein